VSLCNMQCMLQTAPNVLVMGGHQPLLVSFDLETRQEIQQVAESAVNPFPLVSDIATFVLKRDVKL